jgi:beta-galactosidase
MRHAFLNCVIFISCFAITNLQAQPSGRTNFDKDWKFTLGKPDDMKTPQTPVSEWRSIDLPHDWSIEGEFNAKNPATNGGGSLPGGIGWYAKTLNIDSPLKANKLFIEFDGVYMNSTVWVNGYEVGTRPYGYATFQYDITPYLLAGNNSLLVRVDNSEQPNSRWYSGSGIYRHVWLIETPEIHFEQSGTYFTTPLITDKEATVNASASVLNETFEPANVELRVHIYDADGALVSEQRQTQMVTAKSGVTVSQQLKIANPHLWDVEHPYLYKAVTEIYKGNELQQSYGNNIGVRYFHFDADKGFSLNDKPMKILGVCNHHDLGCLGSALNDRALERQLQILKNMGCNAIRTSHNPPAPELLDMCDKMGFLVMDEAFDCWYRKKTKYDFHRFFKDWHEKELSDMVIRDRSHPSIILWSIGNEINEQLTPRGGKIARELKGIVLQYDTTRLVTSALSMVTAADVNGYAAALDVVGINYEVKWYDGQHKKYPNRLYIGSETTSAVASRGVYHGPADKLIYKSADLQCSAYDNCWVPWGRSAEDGWLAVKKRDFMSGLFVWTGFDYIGEPTPYNYPAISSYFGIVDLCGFPKDSYYMYQSQWTKQPVLHLLPHWNWNPGDSVDVLAFTNCDEVKLYLNGQPLGTRNFANTDKVHLAWKVAFAPGTLKAEGYKDGKLIKTDEVKTAGAPAKIQLMVDTVIIKANGTDLCFVTVKVTDANGIMVPNADQLVHFDIEGAGKIAGVDNGNSISLEPHKANQRKAFNGMCLVVIQSNGKVGNIKLKASAPGLMSQEVSLRAE